MAQGRHDPRRAVAAAVPGSASARRWNEEESRGLGFPMPRSPTGSRSSRTRSGSCAMVGRASTAPRRRSRARTVQATRLLNSPQALSRPHPPILIGGGGELKTLRLVARYADACNVFGSPTASRHKYDVLREHCETEGRDYDTIEKTNLTGSMSITPDGAQRPLTPSGLVDRLGAWAEAGSQHTIFSVRNVWDLSRLELIGRDVIPQVRDLGSPSPSRQILPRVSGRDTIDP